MIIKSINIKNFRSYYGDNHVDFSDKLTLLIGDNGDGKTTFFESLEWLFLTAVESKPESNISEKRKSELETGESDEVCVSLSFEHEGDKELTKRFRFYKNDDGSVSIRDYEFSGYVNDGAERRSENGSALLERCFASEIRRYCMFKGESNLDIFSREETAIKKLVDTFSDIRQFDELESLSGVCESKSQNILNNEMKNDRKTADKAKELSTKLKYYDDKINVITEEIKGIESQIHIYTERINQIEAYQEASQKWQEIKKRIASLEDKQSRLRVGAQIDYNTKLLDDYWILKPFGGVLDEFSKKVSKLGLEKRRQERQEDSRRAEEKAKQEVIQGIQQLANGAEPLPWNLPDRATMQEMIDDEVCKVCGRPAPKGSEAYEFMVKRLEEYLQHVQQQKIFEEQHNQQEEKPLFPNSFIEELNHRRIKFCDGESEMWIASLSKTIFERIQLVNRLNSELAKLKNDIQDAYTDLENVSIQSGLGAETLDNSFSNYKGNFDAKERANNRLVDLQADLDRWKGQKDGCMKEYNALEPESSMTRLYQKIHNLFYSILSAVGKAKENNIDSFINLLEQQANIYLQKLNVNDFHGIVKIRRNINGSAQVELHSANGALIAKPNGALNTTMYMSVLFAVSNITTLKREQDYPLIFDAPTSSFGNVKEDVFYNVINTIDKQCIIATKDLLIKRGDGSVALDMDKIKQLSCSVYQLKKADGFQAQDLSTIQTTITKIQ
ncbi:MAG: AAA family ATPase [Bacteroidales bacterium]|nr:AAA family ATPase [Bacteroidales bacterium]